MLTILIFTYVIFTLFILKLGTRIFNAVKLFAGYFGSLETVS